MNDWWNKPRAVSVVVDTPGWFDPYAQELVERATAKGDDARFARSYGEIQEGGVAFYLSCMKIVPPNVLAKNHHNIVVHASALPHGRGFSPVVWQVLEGKDRIQLSMIFAASDVDTGEIVMQDALELEGYELNDEIRKRLGNRIVEMCVIYLGSASLPKSRPQTGEPTWYGRRRPADSRLNPAKSIANQFNLLRVVDNDRYPAFFDYRGHRYLLRVENVGPVPD